MRWYCERLVYAAEAWHEGDGEADVPCALVTHATQGFDFGSAGMRTPVTPSKRKGEMGWRGAAFSVRTSHQTLHAQRYRVVN